MHVCCTDQ